ncbi:hypothetical protein ATANTOWER_011570 [Ataeniobius toweri]|uniref:Uncharacterized protein n=1 Tax=Ataeniobius toweri TaxID=208326 RepID=A0ABU7BZS4_9TELE|nr:hypothetical protein [Ataeniobius toweri]
MLRVQLCGWLEIPSYANPTESLLQFPGTCKPKEGTNLYFRLPASSSSASPPSNSTRHHLYNNQRTTAQPPLWHNPPSPRNVSSTKTVRRFFSQFKFACYLLPPVLTHLS